MNKRNFIKAKDDLFTSLKRYKLWLFLGWSDIQQRYRGSILGPFWITLSMVIFITALSIVYSRLFHQELRTFIPFLTAGILSWTFMSTTVVESTSVFVDATILIENFKLPYTVYILRLVWRNLIIFFHNLVVYLAAALIFQVDITIYTLLFFASLLLISILIACTAMLVALLGTRFRDLPPVITSLVMVLFFVSPITWQANIIGMHSLIIKSNPVVYVIDLLRTPLLGQAPMMISWFVCAGLTLFAFGLSFLLFMRYRSRIPFWI